MTSLRIVLRSALIVLGVLVANTHLSALQWTTLRDLVQAQGDVDLMVYVDGPLITIDDVLRDTDLIVRATVGQGTAAVTPDGRSVTTTHQLLNARVLFSSGVETSTRPGVTGAPITVTQDGGTVVIEGHRVTVHHDGGAPIQPGLDVLVFLHTVGSERRVARRVAIFQVADSKLVRLKRDGSDLELAGRDVDAVVADMISRRQRLP